MNLLGELKLLHLPRHRRMLYSRAAMRILLALPDEIKRPLFFGESHYCPVCQSNVRRYLTFGHIPKSWCPVCAAMKRHRLVWLFFQRHTNLFDHHPKKMLHIAPEVAFEPRLAAVHSLDYVTADLHDPEVMVKMDITDIACPEDTFDVIYCSHVFEHVPEDRKAMREFARVLKPGGWAAFMVPICLDRPTDEDPTITDPAERERRFGQSDHVRYYGLDFGDRLREAGFEVTVYPAPEVVGPSQIEKIGVDETSLVFYCEK